MADEALPFYRLKKKVLFRKHEIERWIEQYWELAESQYLKRIADEAVRKVGQVSFPGQVIEGGLVRGGRSLSWACSLLDLCFKRRGFLGKWDN